ncbi:MAG: phosphate signaling complex protein PhoU [Rhodospirillaceae bacterium]|nr:phosphate signaling complex protein PhoU [Rhodospirillaceae bacterium]
MNKLEHTVQAFDNDLAGQERLVLEMGGLVEAQLSAAIAALMKRDTEAAERIIAKDSDVDDYERKIETGALSIIARRQPMAADLRYVFGTIKMAGSLERMGDYAKNAAKRTLNLAKQPDVTIPSDLQVLGNTVTKMLHDVMNSFSTRDAKKAEAVWQRDWEIDEIAKRVMKKIVADMGRSAVRQGGEANPDVEGQTHLLFIAKNLERVGDHATNIAEVIQFQLSGSWTAGERPKGDTVSRPASS